MPRDYTYNREIFDRDESSQEYHKATPDTVVFNAAGCEGTRQCETLLLSEERPSLTGPFGHEPSGECSISPALSTPRTCCLSSARSTATTSSFNLSPTTSACCGSPSSLQALREDLRDACDSSPYMSESSQASAIPHASGAAQCCIGGGSGHDNVVAAWAPWYTPPHRGEMCVGAALTPGGVGIDVHTPPWECGSLSFMRQSPGQACLVTHGVNPVAGHERRSGHLYVPCSGATLRAETEGFATSALLLPSSHSSPWSSQIMTASLAVAPR